MYEAEPGRSLPRAPLPRVGRDVGGEAAQVLYIFLCGFQAKERTLSKRLVVFSVIALIIGTSVLGCGDDDGDSGDTGATTAAGSVQEGSGDDGGPGDGDAAAANDGSPAKAKFLQQANAICERGSEQMRNAFIEALPEGGGGSKAERQAFDEVKESTFFPVLQERIDQIEALGAPKGEEEEVEETLLAMQQDLDSAEEREITSFQQFEQQFPEADKLASEYGFSSCLIDNSVNDPQ